MVAYRFCRSDDIPLLVDGYNRCWQAHCPDEPALDEAGFKKWVRELQLWTSSCMVAADDDGAFAVLLGCKRDDATLVWRLAVHPERQGQGHARHLLTSLASKLAILGPPVLRAELPTDRPELEQVFAACGYTACGACADWSHDGSRPPAPAAAAIPFSVEDLLANQIFDPAIRRSWQRDLPTLEALRRQISGLALASFDGIEAFLLVREGETDEIASFGSCEREKLDAQFRALLAAWIDQRRRPLTISGLTEDEIPASLLDDLAFRLTSRYRQWETVARPS